MLLGWLAVLVGAFLVWYFASEGVRRELLRDYQSGIAAVLPRLGYLAAGAALAGVLFKIKTTGRFRYLSTFAYAVMGWMAVIAAVPLARTLHGAGMAWLVIGGGLYTLGCVFYLWKRLPYAHMVWHLFVLAGTICHFFCMLFHVNA